MLWVVLAGVAAAVLMLAAAALVVWSRRPRGAARDDAAVDVDVFFDRHASDNEIRALEPGKRVLLAGEKPLVRNGVYVKKVEGLERVPELAQDRQVTDGRLVRCGDRTWTMVPVPSSETHLGMSVGILVMSPADMFFGRSRPANAVIRTDDDGEVFFDKPLSESTRIGGDGESIGQFELRSAVSMVAVSDDEQLVYLGAIHEHRLTDIYGEPPKGMRLHCRAGELAYEYGGARSLYVTVQG